MKSRTGNKTNDPILPPTRSGLRAAPHWINRRGMFVPLEKSKMNLEEVPEWDRYEYKIKCDVCSLITTVLTQEDDRPEYQTHVYVRCTCGNYLEFELPVN
jgi:hypothetical protein